LIQKKYASVASLAQGHIRPRGKDLHNSYLDSPEQQMVSGQKDSPNKLASWFVTGFTDAEGCFGIYIYKNTKYKTN
jgi:hypothetical protein